MDKYYIVDQRLLPVTFKKVIKARHLLDTGKVKRISEAAKMVGISRGSYYKYKDLVYKTNQSSWNQKAVISFMLNNKQGLLSKILSTIADNHASILTINQNIPIHDVASIVISLDLNHMQSTIDKLLKQIRLVNGTSNVKLVSIE